MRTSCSGAVVCTCWYLCFAYSCISSSWWCRALEQQRQQLRRASASADVSDALVAAAAAAATRQQQRINFHVGVLHFTVSTCSIEPCVNHCSSATEQVSLPLQPSSEPFPLLADTVEVSSALILHTKHVSMTQHL